MTTRPSLDKPLDISRAKLFLLLAQFFVLRLGCILGEDPIHFEILGSYLRLSCPIPRSMGVTTTESATAYITSS